MFHWLNFFHCKIILLTFAIGYLDWYFFKKSSFGNTINDDDDLKATSKIKEKIKIKLFSSKNYEKKSRISQACGLSYKQYFDLW